MPGESPWRVAYMDTAEDLGGAEKSLLELVAHLDRRLVHPLLLHTRGAVWLEREDCAGLELLETFAPGGVLERKRDEVGSGLLRSLRGLLASAGPVCRARQSLRQARADLVHTNTLKAHFFGAVAARLAGLPLVWHVRDLLDESEGLGLLRQTAATFRPRVIAISEAVARQFDGLRLTVTVIRNGIPLGRFTPGPPPPDLDAEFGLSPGDLVVCCTGRLTPWKGHRTLLRAFARVREALPQARLLIVGEVAFWADEYEQELRALAAELQLGDRVIWTGFRSDIPDLLRRCEVLVLPSINEPFGRVLIEAMAVGKPVIATATGGAPEIVVPGETGLLISPEDPPALAAALVRLLEDGGLRQRLGAAGLARTCEHFDIRRVAAEVQDLYSRLLHGTAIHAAGG